MSRGRYFEHIWSAYGAPGARTAVALGADEKLDGLVGRRVAPLGVEVVEEPAADSPARRAQLDARRLVVAAGVTKKNFVYAMFTPEMVAGETGAVAVHEP